MKPQDILFLGSYIVLLLVKRPRVFVWYGLICIVIAIPLFAKWIFFTAERLTWYAAAFFLTYSIYMLFQKEKLVKQKKGSYL